MGPHSRRLLEEVEPLGITPLALTRTRDSFGALGSAHGIEHFGMKAEVFKLYERPSVPTSLRQV